MNERTHLDLFSGIGGFALACRIAAERTGATIRTTGFCERDHYCQRVLAKHWPGVPCHDDIRTYRPTERPWLLTGGFPCQPWSQAGLKKGSSDTRHLWPAMVEVIGHTQPDWVFGENVVGFTNMGLPACLNDLEAKGYKPQAFDIPSCAIGLPTVERHVWIVAARNDLGASRNHKKSAPIVDISQAVSRMSEWSHSGASGNVGQRDLPEPRSLRSRKGVPNYMDRIRALGNAIPPQVAAEIIVAMIASE